MLWLPNAVLLPLLLSAGLHAWIEVPALRWGRRYARKVDAAGTLATNASSWPVPTVRPGT
jgi:hypothetical protein